MSAFWRWSFLFCVWKCTVLLLGNYVRWVCHKMWFFFLWECCTSSWKKAIRCQSGCDSIHKTFQQIRFPCRRNCVTAVPSVGSLKRSANKGGTHCHQRRTKLWYHLTFNAPDPFFFFFNTHCPNIEGWPTEKTVWTRSCIHSSCTSTGCPHRSAPSATSSSDGALKRRHKLRFQTAGASSQLKLVLFFSSHQGGWPPTTSWLRATRVSSVTSASKCCTTMPRATRWENSWPTLT